MSTTSMRADWKTRLTQTLEPLLAMSDPRPHISAYHDMPYAIFQYEPEAEFQVRQEIRQLATRLDNAGKRVKRISLAECLREALEAEDLDTQGLVEAETSVGLDATVDTVHQVLFEYQPSTSSSPPASQPMPSPTKTSSSSNAPAPSFPSTGPPPSSNS